MPNAERAARHERQLPSALDAGWARLTAGASALDAVQAAVRVLEDEGTFNAGRGAELTEAGTVELDAALMRGEDRAFGAVAAVKGVRNPIDAARAVLEDGRHVLLVGEGAERFADERGLERVAPDYFVTGDGQRRHDASASGTVGAVARDAHGHLAAATSTGGRSRQRAGRVGDSPLAGAGTWADDATAAVSCTGDGEEFVRALVAHEVDALIRHAGLPFPEACERALAGARGLGGEGGLIAVSASGELAMPFTAPAMSRAWRVGEDEPGVAIT